MPSLDSLPVLGGALCLDFANTIDPRHKEPREEYIGSYAELARWSGFIGALASGRAEELVRAASTRPDEAKAVHARAMELRGALYGAFSESPRAPARGRSLEILQREWRTAMEHATIEQDGGDFELGWGADDGLDPMLWPVAASAVDLLSSPERSRIGECEGDGCGWLFVDTSKAGRRRWCSMAICGNREKARRHRRRAAGDAHVA